MKAIRFLGGQPCWLVLALVLGSFMGAPQTLHARPDLDKHLRKLSGQIKAELDKQNEKSISLGAIQPHPSFAANPGPGLVKILTDELTRLGVSIKYDARLGIIGEIIPDAEDLKNIENVKIKLKMVNKISQTLGEFSLALADKEDIFKVLGSPTNPPKGSKFAEGPYAVEILVNGFPRDGTVKDNVPFVLVERQEIYTIKLINNSDHEAAAWVGIDGLSIFVFNEDPEPDGQARDYRVVLAPRSSREVKGWYFTPEVTKSFMVTDYPQSAAALKKVTANIGMIQVQFQACWPKGGSPPADENQLRGSATGFGPAFSQGWTTLERVRGRTRATITIRYAKD